MLRATRNRGEWVGEKAPCAANTKQRKERVVLALLLLMQGCLARTWNVEESNRIDEIVARRRDPADEAAVEGIPGPPPSARAAAEPRASSGSTPHRARFRRATASTKVKVKK